MGSLGNSLSGLNVIIVGAGIAGLATATALTRNGKKHNITILESHPSLNEFGAAIGITPNGARSLRSLSLESEFAKVVTWNNFIWMSDGFTGETIGYIPENKANYSKTNYGDENWNINRKDYQNVLSNAAQASGAKIVFGVRIEDIDVENCTVTCAHGLSFTADIIIGADGMKSTVRKHIPRTSYVEPVAWKNETAYHCTVPKSTMIENPLLQDLLDVPMTSIYTVSGRYVLMWPLPSNRPFDVTLCITEPGDIPLGKWGHSVDVKEVTSKFQDFCPKIKELLSHMDRVVKWTLGEIPPLETCKSDNGRVILIGDAWHAMLPHSGSGGNSAIEDAVSLAECLQWTWEKHQINGRSLSTAISQATQAFEDLRKPRVERMQKASHEGYTFLSAGGEDAIVRNKALAAARIFYDSELALSEEERLTRQPVQGNMNCRFGLEPYFQWLYRYDAVAETKELLSKLD